MGHWSEQEAEWATGVNRRLSGPLTGLEVLEKCNNCSNCWHSYPGHSNAVTGRKTRKKKKATVCTTPDQTEGGKQTGHFVEKCGYSDEPI